MPGPEYACSPYGAVTDDCGVSKDGPGVHERRIRVVPGLSWLDKYLLPVLDGLAEAAGWHEAPVLGADRDVLLERGLEALEAEAAVIDPVRALAQEMALSIHGAQADPAGGVETGNGGMEGALHRDGSQSCIVTRDAVHSLSSIDSDNVQGGVVDQSLGESHAPLETERRFSDHVPSPGKQN